MKLDDIKKMFVPGEEWQVTRTSGKPLTVVGNLGNTVISANNGSEWRTVQKVRSGDIIFKRQKDGQKVYTAFPKASEVIEAKHGWLQFKYTGDSTEITLALRGYEQSH